MSVYMSYGTNVVGTIDVWFTPQSGVLSSVLIMSPSPHTGRNRMELFIDLAVGLCHGHYSQHPQQNERYFPPLSSTMQPTTLPISIPSIPIGTPAFGDIQATTLHKRNGIFAYGTLLVSKLIKPHYARSLSNKLVNSIHNKN